MSRTTVTLVQTKNTDEFILVSREDPYTNQKIPRIEISNRGKSKSSKIFEVLFKIFERNWRTKKRLEIRYRASLFVERARRCLGMKERAPVTTAFISRDDWRMLACSLTLWYNFCIFFFLRKTSFHIGAIESSRPLCQTPTPLQKGG